jgi:hypothetical protein
MTLSCIIKILFSWSAVWLICWLWLMW